MSRAAERSLVYRALVCDQAGRGCVLLHRKQFRVTRGHVLPVRRHLRLAHPRRARARWPAVEMWFSSTSSVYSHASPRTTARWQLVQTGG